MSYDMIIGVSDGTNVLNFCVFKLCKRSMFSKQKHFPITIVMTWAGCSTSVRVVQIFRKSALSCSGEIIVKVISLFSFDVSGDLIMLVVPRGVVPLKMNKFHFLAMSNALGLGNGGFHQS